MYLLATLLWTPVPQLMNVIIKPANNVAAVQHIRFADTSQKLQLIFTNIRLGKGLLSVILTWLFMRNALDWVGKKKLLIP